MVKKELVKIESFEGENHSQVFVMSMSVKGLGLYDKAKATNRFINTETKVLEQVLETILRNYIKQQGIIVQEGGYHALEKAFWELEQKGKEIEIIDRYKDIANENIVGENHENGITVILEEEILSSAIELVIKENKNG